LLHGCRRPDDALKFIRGSQLPLVFGNAVIFFNKVRNVRDRLDPPDHVAVIIAKNGSIFKGMDGAAIFMNRTAHAQVVKDANAKTNVLYTVDNIFGKYTAQFMGVPILLEEQLLITESALT